MCLVLEMCKMADDCDSCRNKCYGAICICQCMILYTNHVQGHSDREKRFWLGSLICCYSLTLVILASIAVAVISKQQDVLSATLENWKTDPITDIQILKADPNQILLEETISCPEDYEEFLEFKLPAIRSGCHCPQGHVGLGFGSEKVTSGRCSNDEIREGCRTVIASESMFIRFWPLYSTPILLCVKRVHGQNFYNQTKAKINTSPDRCIENNMKVCESNSTDTFYCMPIQEPCPIRELKIAIEPLTVEEISEGKWELLKTPIGPMSPENFSGVSMYQRRVGKSMPLSRMKGGSGEGICINDDVLSLDPSRSDDYVLNNPQSEQCSLDKRYKLFLESFEQKVFLNNNLINKIQATRPMYPINATVKVGIYTTSYFEFKPKCREKQYSSIIQMYFSFDQIDKLKEQTRTLLTAQILVLVFACIYLIIMIVILINELVRCFYDCCNCKKITKHIMLGGRWLFSLILVGFIIYAFSYSIRVKGRFRDIIDNECSDDQSAEVYQELIKGIDESVIPLNTSILVMFFIVFLIDCSVMWHHQFHKMRKRHYRQNKNLPVPPIEQEIVYCNDGQEHVNPGYQPQLPPPPPPPQQNPNYYAQNNQYYPQQYQAPNYYNQNQYNQPPPNFYQQNQHPDPFMQPEPSRY